MTEKTDNRASIKISRELLESLKDRQTAVRKKTGREPTQSDLLQSAWAAYETVQGDFSPGDPSRSLTNRDNIADQSAKFPRDWTDKERADAKILIEIMRGENELSARTIALVIEGWRLEHGDAVQSRVHKRKRA